MSKNHSNESEDIYTIFGLFYILFWRILFWAKRSKGLVGQESEQDDQELMLNWNRTVYGSLTLSFYRISYYAVSKCVTGDSLLQRGQLIISHHEVSFSISSEHL